MKRRVAGIVGMLTGGALAVGTLYWLLLNTPESNVLMLSASALTILLMLAVGGIVVNTSVIVAQGVPLGAAAVRQAVLYLPRFLGGFAIAAGLWFLVGQVDLWFAARFGEISAWFIATFNIADAQWIFTAQAWIGEWVRWVLAPVLCVAVIAGGAARRAFAPRTLIISSVAWLLLIVLPWPLAEWRPALPPTWVEPTVAALRLAAVFLLAILAVAVMVVVTAAPRDTPAGQQG